MLYLPLFIGVIISLIGLAIIPLAIVFLRIHRAQDIASGIIFLLIGLVIIWLSLQGNVTYLIDIGIRDDQFGFILAGFVLSLFILKGILDYREGSRRLKDGSLSSIGVWTSRFQVIVAYILIVFAVILVFVLISTQSGSR